MKVSSRSGRKPGLPPRGFKDFESSNSLNIFQLRNEAPHIQRRSLQDEVNIDLGDVEWSDGSDAASKASSSLSSLSTRGAPASLQSHQPYVDIGKQLQVRTRLQLSLRE